MKDGNAEETGLGGTSGRGGPDDSEEWDGMSPERVPGRIFGPDSSVPVFGAS